MKILRMVSSDLQEVASLAEQLGYPNSVEDLKARFEEIHVSPDYALFVAKTSAGKVVGYIQVNREPAALLAGPRAEVAGLVVDQDERSKGIGAALLKEAEEWARSHPLLLIRIRSNVKREDAHRFYRKNGYEIKKSWHVFGKEMS